VAKRRDLYEILNRSSRTLNDYEFNKVLYGKFFDLISTFKTDLNTLFFNTTDKRGELQTEIIDIIVLSSELPNSWSSVNTIRDKYYVDNLGNTQESVDRFLEKNEENIKSKIAMIKKIIICLKDNKFFSSEKKIFHKYFLPYKFIISRLLFKFKDISLFNRHIMDIIQELRTEITEIDIQDKLKCKSRNAMFQKRLIQHIDSIIHTSYERNKERRLFSKTDITNKLKEQNDVCAHCHLSKERYEADHIISWSKGGKTNYENLQILCMDCHRKKTATSTM
jgi:hypothetical protein